MIGVIGSPHPLFWVCIYVMFYQTLANNDAAVSLVRGLAYLNNILVCLGFVYLKLYEVLVFLVI